MAEINAVSSTANEKLAESAAGGPLRQLETDGRLVADGKRDATGRVGVGNSLAVKNGRHSRRLQENAAPWRAEQIAAIRADVGDDVATLKGHVIEQLGTVLVILRFLGGNLMADGPLTAKGKQRAATTAYLQTLDRFVRLTDKVGLERAAKQLPNPADWLEGRA
jgi:hypothetical protein